MSDLQTLEENLQTLEERIVLSEKTALVGITQVTVDANVRMSYEDLMSVLESASQGDSRFANNVRELIGKIKSGEQTNGEPKGITNNELDELERKVEKITPRSEWSFAIGGSPAIASVAMHYYARDDDSIDVYFAGNLVQTTIEALRRNPELVPVFGCNKITNDRPRTLSLEDYDGKYRIMIPFSEGRRLSELCRNSFFRYLQDLGKDYKRVMINIAGLNKGKPSEYSGLIEDIRKGVDSVAIYVGTNDFTNEKEEDKKDYLKIVLNSHFASMNDCEVRQLYEAVGGEPSRAIGEILDDIENRASGCGISSERDKILIVHSANGAVIKLYGEYSKLSKEEVKKAVQYAVDATTFRLLTGAYPVRKRIEGQVTQRFRKRNVDIFEKEFGAQRYLNKKGMLYAISPQTTNKLGDTTGAGSTFDGIMMYYLSKLIER